MNYKRKILTLTIVVALLGSVIFGSAYFVFFADRGLINLGYKDDEIDILKNHKLQKVVTNYNPSLIYALRSENFEEKNLEYYLEVVSSFDLTDKINAFAKYYSIDEYNALTEILSQDEIFELADKDQLRSVSDFIRINKYGYDKDTAALLTNEIAKENLDTFLSLPVLTDPLVFNRYLEKGYETDLIAKIFRNVSLDEFYQLADMRYFSDINGLIEADGFQLVNLARYMWYKNSSKADYATIVKNVNSNKDVTAVNKINFSKMYSTNTVDENDFDTLTILVNKTHNLKESYSPQNLTSLEEKYRTTSQQLVYSAAEAFVQMALELENENGKTIVTNYNYYNYTTAATLYEQYFTASTNNTAAEIDSFAFKAGADEHQSGLATDISETDKSVNDFAKSAAGQWVSKNAYRFGWILRFPEGKEFITGVKYNGYHYRYVGEDVAKIIHDNNWTLEEYYYLYIGD